MPASRRSTSEQLEAAEVDGANAVQRFRHVTLPGLKYVIIVVLLLSFISTFNQFGLIFLMTGGGPGGATKLYSILAYEKAIGSLQYGPGSAIALSVAPLMAIIIWLLARFMRHDERAARVPNVSRASAIAHLASSSAACSALFLDLVFWPFDMLYRGVRGDRQGRSPARDPATPTSPCSSQRAARTGRP